MKRGYTTTSQSEKRLKRGTTRGNGATTLVDGRHWRDERQCDNQLDKRHERGAMRGGAMRGGGASGREAAE
jgi:hypothetical protein